MFYALSRLKLLKVLENQIDKFIAIAPLTFISGPGKIAHDYHAFFDSFDSSNINVIYGPKWAQYR